MDFESKAEKALAMIRDASALFNLRRRPRCSDGSLDMRNKVNKVLMKSSQVTDYYDPKEPSVTIKESVI